MVGSNDQKPPTDTEIDRELDQFVYHISHDLRASMRALVLVPGWIEEDLQEQFGSVPTSIQEHVTLLTEQARRLDAMMKDLLVYSRIGRMQSVGPIDLDTVLDAVLAELELPQAFELTRDLAVQQMVGWPNDVEVLLYQLISNVVKHGGARAHLRTEARGGGLALHIKDDGPGIDPKQHNRIFEMMTTLKPRDEVEGSGLGLAIARKIMTLHGGTITVVSDGLGNGSEFVANFPKIKAG